MSWRTSSLSLAVAAFAIALPFVGTFAQERKGRKVALLVAVQDYSDTGLTNLKYCENDITALAAVLKTQGYKDDDVIVLTDSAAAERKKLKYVPTADNVRRELKGLIEDLRAEDTFLIAFSGHGAHLKALKERGLHFCAKGTDLEKPATMVSLAEVYEQLEKHCKAELKLLFVDACRNDPTDGKAGADGRLESLTRPLVPDPPGGTVAFFSCSTGQKSYESDKLKHGVFFHHVIEGLKGGPADEPISRQGEVTVGLLEDYLSRTVPVAVKKDRDDRSLRQIPERKGNLRGSGILAMVGGIAPPPKGEPKPGEEREFEIADGVKMTFCYIPKGKTKLGAPTEEKGRDNDDLPERDYEEKVGFWLGKYEVTQKQWEAVMGENPSYFSSTGGGKEKVVGRGTAFFPVEQVSFDDIYGKGWKDGDSPRAGSFLDKLNKRPGIATTFGKNAKLRLPHEDRWEYAYRGGKGNKTAYYWGDEITKAQANFSSNVGWTTAVGEYEKAVPHPWGLCDMSGNVWEWCENEYSKDRRVLRGGSWRDGAWLCRAAYRNFNAPDGRYTHFGFRGCVVLD